MKRRRSGNARIIATWIETNRVQAWTQSDDPHGSKSLLKKTFILGKNKNQGQQVGRLRFFQIKGKRGAAVALLFRAAAAFVVNFRVSIERI